MERSTTLGAAFLTLTVLSAPLCASRQQTHGDPVISVEGIDEYRLANGLRVLLFPDPSKKTVTVNVTYMVGSNQEGRGEKGMAHLLEHMVFKGTDTYPNIWGALEDHGARFNGTTWVDRTNYFETLPATEENLRFALDMEADRMVNSRIAAEDLKTEMTVVRNEFERGENDPAGVLFERIVSAAYLWHNYGLSTIGNRSDLERVPVENLRAFYRRYYQPDNALLVIAGAFEPELALELVKEHFGPIPRPERVLDRTWTEEPVQDGARFVTLERVASTQAAGVTYHVCAGSHPDAAALQVLAHVLTTEPSGRLYEALIPTDLATGVGDYYFLTAEPGHFTVMLECNLDQDVQKAHDRMLEVLENLASKGLEEEEVERAKTRLLKDIKLAMNSSGRIGVELSEWQALGDWRMFFLNRDRLKEITVADVQRVAERYFRASNRTSGLFRPVEEPRRTEVPATPDVMALVEDYRGSETIAQGEAFEPTPENIEARTVRSTLPGGMRLALLPKETRGDAVVAQISLLFGDEGTLRGRDQALGLLPRLMMRGTGELDYQGLRDAIDALGSRINVSGTPGRIDASITAERGNLGASIQLLADILRRPSLPAEEFEILKKEALAALEESSTDPQALAINALQRALSPFPPESIHYVPTIEEEIARLRAVRLQDLQDLHAKLLGASHALASVVGDFDPEAVRAELALAFDDWASPRPYQRIARPFAPAEPREATIQTPDKKNAVVLTGAVMNVSDEDPSYPALAFANYILGESAKSRLLTRLRHEGGLSYAALSRLQADALDPVAMLFGFAICAPENASLAEDAMREEFARWIEEGVSETELAEGKPGFLQRLENQLANDNYVAGELVDGMIAKRTFAYQARLMEAISGLDEESVDEAIQRHAKEARRAEIKAGDLERAPD